MTNTEKLEIFWSEFTKEAQARIMEFDSDIPEEILSGKTSVITIRKAPSKEDISKLLDGLLDRVRDRVAKKEAGRDVPHKLPRDIMEAAKEKIRNGEDVGGVILDKRTGEYSFIKESELDDVIHQVGGQADIGAIEIGGEDDCDCPECQARRAGYKADPKRWN